MLDTLFCSALCTIVLLVDLSFQTIDKPTHISATTNSSVISKQNTNVALKDAYVEGGRVPLGRNNGNDHTHDSRENTPELRKEVSTSLINKKSQATSDISQKGGKIINSEFNATKNDSKISSAISQDSSSNINGSSTKAARTTAKTTTTTKKLTVSTTPKPFKPLRTEHDDGFVVKNTEEHARQLPNIETYTEKKTRSADYVVPIVAIIFSVPLVAFIISVVYKRGTDWWQHRNYRRMDFLIDGMYNS